MNGICIYNICKWVQMLYVTFKDNVNLLILLLLTLL